MTTGIGEAIAALAAVLAITGVRFLVAPLGLVSRLQLLLGQLLGEVPLTCRVVVISRD